MPLIPACDDDEVRSPHAPPLPPATTTRRSLPSTPPPHRPATAFPLQVSESGRLPPTEKMLGLAPGYLAKPSPAASPWLGIEGVGGAPRTSNAHSQVGVGLPAPYLGLYLGLYLSSSSPYLSDSQVGVGPVFPSPPPSVRLISLTLCLSRPRVRGVSRPRGRCRRRRRCSSKSGATALPPTAAAAAAAAAVAATTAVVAAATGKSSGSSGTGGDVPVSTRQKR